MHWVCAVIFMQAKRIQFYDSMGGDGRRYLDALFQYLKDEHQDKKKCPLPDEDEWEFIECTSDTPRQRNGTSFRRAWN
jgi:sentrin-specific protease 1